MWFLTVGELFITGVKVRGVQPIYHVRTSGESNRHTHAATAAHQNDSQFNQRVTFNSQNFTPGNNAVLKTPGYCITLLDVLCGNTMDYATFLRYYYYDVYESPLPPPLPPLPLVPGPKAAFRSRWSPSFTHKTPKQRFFPIDEDILLTHEATIKKGQKDEGCSII